MRRLRSLLFGLLSLGLAASAAHAVLIRGGGTTFVAPVVTTFSTDCAANLTVSNGGLTVTSTATGTVKACRANVAKYSGQWYYEVAFGGVFSDLSFGLADNGTAQPINGGFTLTPGNILGQSNNDSAGFGCNGTKVNWQGQTTANAAAACATGHVAGVYFDADHDPPQMWVTPDVNSLLCNGSGGSGSTAPKFNGACTEDPSIPGTGGPLSGTVKGIWLPGSAYFPAMTVNANAGSATFNFGASAFAIASLSPGYASWNTTGGAAPVPGPLSPQQINVANAPEWQTSHAYVLGDRIVAGPAWAAGSPGSYTNGANLYLWGVKTAGTSSGSGNGPQACGSPAGVGGGLDGSIPAGWTGATTASDGGVTWVCLSKIDYVTMTGAFKDTPLVWTTSTTYTLGDYVNTGNHVYALRSVPSGQTCTTGASVPTGTTLGLTSSDGTCTWTFVGNLTYTSRANIWPHQTAPISNFEINFNWNVFVTVWYGGHQREIYRPGANNEIVPLLMDYHSDAQNDQELICQRSQIGTHRPSNYPGSTGTSCNGVGNMWVWTVQTPTGDSWAENVVANTTPLRIDQTKGVTFSNNSSPTFFALYYATAGEALALSDQAGTFKGFQFQSTQGMCISGHALGNPGGQHVNGIILTRMLFDCGGATAPAGIALDSSMDMNNSILIFRSTRTGSTAIHNAYPGTHWNNTIVCGGGTDQTVLQDENFGIGFFSGTLFPPPWNNNVMIGCPLGFAFRGTPWTSFNAANNATTAAGGASGTITSALGGTLNVTDFPGVGSTCVPPGNSSTCLGLTATDLVVNPTIGASIDLRVKNSTTAPVYGSGANFSFPTLGSYMGTFVPGPDIYNTARPIAGRFDSGADMFVP